MELLLNCKNLDVNVLPPRSVVDAILARIPPTDFKGSNNPFIDPPPEEVKMDEEEEEDWLSSLNEVKQDIRSEPSWDISKDGELYVCKLTLGNVSPAYGTSRRMKESKRIAAREWFTCCKMENPELLTKYVARKASKEILEYKPPLSESPAFTSYPGSPVNEEIMEIETEPMKEELEYMPSLSESPAFTSYPGSPVNEENMEIETEPIQFPNPNNFLLYDEDGSAEYYPPPLYYAELLNRFSEGLIYQDHLMQHILGDTDFEYYGETMSGHSYDYRFVKPFLSRKQVVFPRVTQAKNHSGYLMVDVSLPSFKGGYCWLYALPYLMYYKTGNGMRNSERMTFKAPRNIIYLREELRSICLWSIFLKPDRLRELLLRWIKHCYSVPKLQVRKLWPWVTITDYILCKKFDRDLDGKYLIDFDFELEKNYSHDASGIYLEERGGAHRHFMARFSAIPTTDLMDSRCPAIEDVDDLQMIGTMVTQTTYHFLINECFFESMSNSPIIRTESYDALRMKSLQGLIIGSDRKNARYTSWKSIGIDTDDLIYMPPEPLKHYYTATTFKPRHLPANTVNCGPLPAFRTATPSPTCATFYPSSNGNCFAECLAFHLYVYGLQYNTTGSRLTQCINLAADGGVMIKEMDDDDDSYVLKKFERNQNSYHDLVKATRDISNSITASIGELTGRLKYELNHVLQACADHGIAVVHKGTPVTKTSLAIFFCDTTDSKGIVSSTLHCEYILHLDASIGVIDPLHPALGKRPTSMCIDDALPDFPSTLQYTLSRRWLTSSCDAYTSIDEAVLYLHSNTKEHIFIALSRGSKLTVKYSEIVCNAGVLPRGIYLINENNVHWRRATIDELTAHNPRVCLTMDPVTPLLSSSTTFGYDTSTTTKVYVPKEEAPIEDKTHYYMTKNMNDALSDARKKHTTLKLHDQTTEFVVEEGIYAFIDPPRRHLFNYRLYGNSHLQGDVKSKKFKIVNSDGTGASLYYPPFAHDSLMYKNGAGYLFERIRSYNVGSEVLLSIYVVRYFEGGSGESGAMIPFKDDNDAAGVLSLNSEQKEIIHKSLLTHYERIDKIANKDPQALSDAYAFVVATSRDRDAINEEDFTLYVVRAAKQVKMHTGDVIKPLNKSEKLALRRKKYAPKSAAVDTLYRRMLWLKSPHHIQLKDYIDGIREYPIWFYVALMLLIPKLVLLLGYFHWFWLLTTIITILAIYCEYTRDYFPIWYSRIKSWRATHGCPNCKSTRINCRWCDTTKEYYCKGIGARYLNNETARIASSNKSLFPMVLDKRLDPSQFNLEYLNNYEAISDIRSLPRLAEDLEHEPYEQGSTYFSSLLPELYNQHRFNCVVPNDLHLLTALITRQGHYDTQPDPEYLEKIKYGPINTDLYDRAVLTAPIQDQAAFLKDTIPSKRKPYARSLKRFETNPKLRNSYRAMCKKGETGPNDQKSRKARLICDPNEDMVGVGAWVGRNEMSVMKKYWKLLTALDPRFINWPALRKKCKIFIQGMNGDAVKTTLEDALNSFKNPIMYWLDIKNFDSSEAEILMQLIDFAYRRRNTFLYARLKMNRQQIKYFLLFAQTARAYIDFMRENKNPRFRVRRKNDLIRLLRIVAKQTTFSGDPLKTTLGNTNRQLHFIYCMLIHYCLLDDSFAIASGDDMWIVIEEAIQSKFEAALDELYAKPGMEGKYGSGLILREVGHSKTTAKFLSKNIVVREQAGHRRVYYYRQVERLLRTGEISVKPSRKFLKNEHFNYMIQEQLREQVSGDPGLAKVLAWREARLPMQKPSKKIMQQFYDDYEECYKQFLHKGHHSDDMWFCSRYDKHYAMLIAGATPEEILLA